MRTQLISWNNVVHMINHSIVSGKTLKSYMTTDNYCLSRVVVVLQHIVAPLDIQRRRSDATKGYNCDRFTQAIRSASPTLSAWHCRGISLAKQPEKCLQISEELHDDSETLLMRQMSHEWVQKASFSLWTLLALSTASYRSKFSIVNVPCYLTRLNKPDYINLPVQL